VPFPCGEHRGEPDDAVDHALRVAQLAVDLQGGAEVPEASAGRRSSSAASPRLPSITDSPVLSPISRETVSPSSNSARAWSYWPRRSRQ
jgi:hypothetical protein